jgi:hypothetical protein
VAAAGACDRRRAGLAAGLYVIYEWGRFSGGYNKFAEVQRRRELVAQIDALGQENEKLRGDIAKVELASKVDNKSYGDVEKNLRRPAGPGPQTTRGADVLSRHRFARGRHRRPAYPGFSGAIRRRRAALPAAARVATVDAWKTQWSPAPSTSRSRARAPTGPNSSVCRSSRIPSKGTGQLQFKFRYFQKFEQGVVLPEGFEPRAVNVEVRSTRLATPVRESYPWQVQAESLVVPAPSATDPKQSDVQKQ